MARPVVIVGVVSGRLLSGGVWMLGAIPGGSCSMLKRMAADLDELRWRRTAAQSCATRRLCGPSLSDVVSARARSTATEDPCHPEWAAHRAHRRRWAVRRPCGRPSRSRPLRIQSSSRSSSGWAPWSQASHLHHPCVTVVPVPGLLTSGPSPIGGGVVSLGRGQAVEVCARSSGLWRRTGAWVGCEGLGRPGLLRRCRSAS